MPKNHLDSFIRFDRTPTCDGQTDRHRPTASTADAQHRAVKTRRSLLVIVRWLSIALSDAVCGAGERHGSSVYDAALLIVVYCVDRRPTASSR